MKSLKDVVKDIIDSGLTKAEHVETHSTEIIRTVMENTRFKLREVFFTYDGLRSEFTDLETGKIYEVYVRELDK